MIDVNSGNRTKAGNVQETNALEVNLAAVDEVARQLRLRDMGGIIVIDLIDMQEPDHKNEVYERMRVNMQNDSEAQYFAIDKIRFDANYSSASASANIS